MTGQKIQPEDSWKFRIVDITPFFKEVKNGIFTKIREDDNLYTCIEEYHDVVEGYISNGLLKLYVPEEEPLRVPTKRYEVEDGRFVIYESKLKPENGKMIWGENSRSITDNFYIALDEDIEFDDGIEKIHKYRGRIIVDNGANEFKFDVDSRLFATPQDMAKLLSNVGGAKVVFDNNQLKDIRIAMQKTSEYESRKISQVFGWQSNKVYQSQSAMIFPGIVRNGDSNVDLSEIVHARNLDIRAITDGDFKKVGDHICKDLLNVHERYPIDCLFGFTFLAPIASQIVNSKRWSGGRIGMWLAGSSECGKSHTALLFQNFFGDFTGDGSTLGWGGTPYSIQDGGYYFKDVLCMVDDFKIAAFTQYSISTVIAILQNYAEGTSRTRFDMTSGHIKGGKPIRGSLLITGEDLLDDISSIMTRYHVVKMDEKYMNPPAFAATKDYLNLYNGFMGRYISWIMKDSKVVSKIVDRIEKSKSEFMAKYEGVNVNRIAQSFAYNLVGFDMFCRFLAENSFISMEKQIKMVKIHKKNLFSKIDPHVADAKDATVGSTFIHTLIDLISSGAVRIHTVGTDKPIAYGGNTEYIGFDDLDEYIYFFATNILGSVKKAAGSDGRLMNSTTNLISELIKRDIMVPHLKKDGTKGTNTHKKMFYGSTIATWRIRKSALGYVEEEVTDEDMKGW